MKTQSFGALARATPGTRHTIPHGLLPGQFTRVQEPIADLGHAMKSSQRGVVLFIALIALVAMSLAAVALIRSVDTSTIIAGNLAFRQAATTSADGGIDSALTWLTTTNNNNTATDPATSATHPFNNTSVATGYYSNADPALSLKADTTWTSSSKLVGTDSSGNTVRYLIQRMCRLPNQVQSDTNCLLSDAEPGTAKEGKEVPVTGKPPLYRITVRVTGPKNTISYVQAFVY